MAYPGGSREINHVNMTVAQSLPPPYSYNISMSMNMYWDRATGVLTKMYMEDNTTTTYTTFYSVSIELTESNVWVVPELVGLPQTLLLLASLAVVTVAYTRKLRNTESH